MINIKRVTSLQPKTNDGRAEITAMLRDLNAEFKGLNVISMEAMTYDAAATTFAVMTQIGMESVSMGSVGKELVTSTGNAVVSVSKAGGIKKAVIGAMVVAAITLVGILSRSLAKFYSFAEKAKRTFEKVQSVILVNAANVDKEAYLAAEAKVIKTDEFQTLFKTAGVINAAIKSFASSFTSKEIKWKKEQFNGMTFDAAASPADPSFMVIKKITLDKSTKATKTKLGAAGWSVDKVIKIAPAMKNLIDAAMEYKKINSALNIEIGKLKDLQKATKKEGGDTDTVKKQIVMAKNNLSDFNKVLKAYYSLIGLLCGQFFTLVNQMKIKK